MKCLVTPAAVVAALACVACQGETIQPHLIEEISAPDVELVQVSDVEWGPLNPARGDRGPKAATLWGDRSGPGPSGFLVEFAEGFSSPPHIHNVTYRGVVLQGLVHNDDPAAAEMWMPAGSFWTQPAGEIHITAAAAPSNLAYIEIDDGPYLVLPTEDAVDQGERPINVDPSNLVWLEASSVAWPEVEPATSSAGEAKVALLWDQPRSDALSGTAHRGTMLELPPGFAGELRNHGGTLRAVVVQGRIDVPETGHTGVGAGSYFGAEGYGSLFVSCQLAEPCILYLRAEGTFGLPSTQSPHAQEEPTP